MDIDLSHPSLVYPFENGQVKLRMIIPRCKRSSKRIACDRTHGLVVHWVIRDIIDVLSHKNEIAKVLETCRRPSY